MFGVRTLVLPYELTQEMPLSSLVIQRMFGLSAAKPEVASRKMTKKIEVVRLVCFTYCSLICTSFFKSIQDFIHTERLTELIVASLEFVRLSTPFKESTWRQMRDQEIIRSKILRCSINAEILSAGLVRASSKIHP